MMEKHSSAWRQQSAAAGCGVGGLKGSRACAPSSLLPLLLACTTSCPLQLREWLSPPSVCCPGCLPAWQQSPKADPIRSLSTEGELGEADITSQSQRAQAAPGAAQQSAGPDLLALPSPTLKLVTVRPRLVANSDPQAARGGWIKDSGCVLYKRLP